MPATQSSSEIGAADLTRALIYHSLLTSAEIHIVALVMMTQGLAINLNARFASRAIL